MISINKEDFFQIGMVTKPHGLKGEMVIETDVDLEETLNETECLMLEIEGGLVPFFIGENGIRYRNSSTLLVKFDDYDTAEKIKPLCGCKVFLTNDVQQEEEMVTGLDTLLDFLVFDEQKGELGRITRMDDFSGNIVLTISYLGKEILLPLSDELITKFDESKKEIHLDCPDGLIELYLES